MHDTFHPAIFPSFNGAQNMHTSPEPSHTRDSLLILCMHDTFQDQLTLTVDKYIKSGSFKFTTYSQVVTFATQKSPSFPHIKLPNCDQNSYKKCVFFIVIALHNYN